jgi:hypothetical protein
MEAASLVDQVWGKWEEENREDKVGMIIEKGIGSPEDRRYHVRSTEQQWELSSTPLTAAAFDLEPIVYRTTTLELTAETCFRGWMRYQKE